MASGSKPQVGGKMGGSRQSGVDSNADPSKPLFLQGLGGSNSNEKLKPKNPFENQSQTSLLSNNQSGGTLNTLN